MEEKHYDAGTLSVSGVESPSSEPASSRRRPGAQKRKASSLAPSSSLTTPSKRVTRARQVPSSLPATASAYAAGGVAAPASSVKAESAIGLGVPRAEAVLAPAGTEKLNKEINLEALEASFEAKFEAIRSRGANAHVVPNHCGWFTWKNIHPIEERTMPTFFNSTTKTRTSHIYMEIRNWILKKFHTNPNVQIQLEDLSELESGDLDAKQEVMEFLDHWGLINFHPYPPMAESSSPSNNIDEGLPNNSLVEKLYLFETLNSCSLTTPKTTVTPAMPSGLFPESVIAEDLTKPEGPSVDYHCNSCSGDCSRKRYHCQKQADFDLCTECFNSGKFDSNMSSSDFILMEPAEVHGVSGGKWTDQETLLLLEALELYKENWSEIAEHVATKTKAQCILHFLQMPIEDTFLDFNEDVDSITKKTADPPSNKSDSAIPKDAAEVKDGTSDVKEEQHPTSPTEATEMKANQKNSKAEEASETKDALENSKSENGHLEISETENCAVKALKEAFEAIGSLSIPESSISFADVGNPVMALAAFLARLVGPEIAGASAHNSFKAISGSSPSIELAARHCFFLEDPPDDMKEPNSESGMIGGTSLNDENQQAKLKDCASLDETKNTEVLKDVRANIMKESDVKSVVGVAPTSEEEGGVCMRGSSPPTTAKDANVSEMPPLEKIDLHEPVTSNCVGEVTPSKDGEMMLDSQPLSKKEPLLAAVSSPSGGALQPKVLQKDVDMVSDSHQETSNSVLDNGEIGGPCDSLHSEKSVPLQPVLSTSVLNGPGEGQDEEYKEGKGFKGRGNDDKTENLKNAAVTALSAATVKARLLANEEEEQIRQLAVFLIEKQLHKLESKLAFFDDMDNVIIRVREQLDRSKQKLYQERAQIIASRLGLPASSGKAMPPRLPTGRIATNYGNSVPRPPSSMTPQRPPFSRPMGSGAPTSGLFVSSTVAGSSFRPPA